jgi:hypothetical protein
VEKVAYQELQHKVRELVGALDALDKAHGEIGRYGGRPWFGLPVVFVRHARYLVTEWDRGCDPVLNWVD